MTEVFTGINVVNARRLPFPSDRVYDAFATPEHLAQWWGPDGFASTVTALDLRPGGDFHVTMTSPEGKAFHNRKLFIDVVPGERIVHEHLEPIHHFLMTMGFEDAGDDTVLTWRMQFAPFRDAPFDPEDMADFIHAANEQNFDRLEAFLQR